MGGFNFQLCVPCPGPFLGLCLIVALRWSCYRYRLSLVDGVFGSLPDDPRQQSVRWPRPPPDVDFLYRDVLVYLFQFSKGGLCLCVL